MILSVISPLESLGAAADVGVDRWAGLLDVVLARSHDQQVV
jgi:hypothetical protein